MGAYNPNHICKHCHMAYKHHGTKGNPYRPCACPAKEEFPEYPKWEKDGIRAEEMFDKAIKDFWTARTTSFEPV